MPVRQVQDNPIYAGMIESMDTAVGIVSGQTGGIGTGRQDGRCLYVRQRGSLVGGRLFQLQFAVAEAGKDASGKVAFASHTTLPSPASRNPNRHCDVPVIGADFFPTILELAGLPLMPEQHLDGVSLLPLLQGKAIGPRDLFWHYPHYGNQGGEPCSIIRSGDWKLIHYWEDGRDELYNLARDQREQHDVSAAQLEVCRQLRGKLDKFLAEVDARKPIPNPRYDAELAARQAEQMRTKRIYLRWRNNMPVSSTPSSFPMPRGGIAAR